MATINWVWLLVTIVSNTGYCHCFSELGEDIVRHNDVDSGLQSDMEPQFDMQKRGRRNKKKQGVAKVKVVPFEEGMDVREYWEGMIATGDCPGELKRKNVMYKNARFFIASVAPKSSIQNKAKPAYSLYGAISKKDNSKLYLTMRNSGPGKVTYRRKDGQPFYIRRLCTWTFIVTEMSYKYYLEGKEVKEGKKISQKYVPVTNRSWFSFGCNKNKKWLVVDKVVISMVHPEGARYHLQDVYAEVCVE